MNDRNAPWRKPARAILELLVLATIAWIATILVQEDLSHGLTTADSNHIAPLARSVPVAGKHGLVGLIAACQPVSAESLYPPDAMKPKDEASNWKARNGAIRQRNKYYD